MSRCVLGIGGKNFFVWGNIGGMWTVGVDLGLLLLLLLSVWLVASAFRNRARGFANHSAIKRLLGGFRVCLAMFVVRDGFDPLSSRLCYTNSHGFNVTCLYMV